MICPKCNTEMEEIKDMDRLSMLKTIYKRLDRWDKKFLLLISFPIFPNLIIIPRLYKCNNCGFIENNIIPINFPYKERKPSIVIAIFIGLITMVVALLLSLLAASKKPL